MIRAQKSGPFDVFRGGRMTARANSAAKNRERNSPDSFRPGVYNALQHSGYLCPLQTQATLRFVGPVRRDVISWGLVASNHGTGEARSVSTGR